MSASLADSALQIAFQSAPMFILSLSLSLSGSCRAAAVVSHALYEAADIAGINYITVLAPPEMT